MVNSTPIAASDVVATSPVMVSPLVSIDSPSVPEPVTSEPVQNGDDDSMEGVEQSDPAASTAPSRDLHHSSNLSKYANPMISINTKPVDLYKIAEENLEKMKSEFTILYANYLSIQDNVNAEETNLAFKKCQEAKKKVS